MVLCIYLLVINHNNNNNYMIIIYLSPPSDNTSEIRRESISVNYLPYYSTRVHGREKMYKYRQWDKLSWETVTPTSTRVASVLARRGLLVRRPLNDDHVTERLSLVGYNNMFYADKPIADRKHLLKSCTRNHSITV